MAISDHVVKVWAKEFAEGTIDAYNTADNSIKVVILFDYSTSQAQEVPTRLLEGYRGYVMTDDYAGYNALGA
jgi:hypothetical protein